MSLPVRTILIASPYYPPHGGGLEQYVANLTAELLEAGERVIIVTSGQHHGSDEIERRGRLTIYRLGYSLKLSNTPLSWRWRKRARQIIRDTRPDIINVHGPVPGMADLVAGVAGHAPVVVTWHAGSMRKAGGGLLNAPIWLYERLIMPRLMRRASRIITTSATVAKGFLSQYKIKISTVTPGVDLDAFRPAGASAPKKSSLLFVAGSFGAGYEHKGLGHLIAALPAILAAAPNTKLTVVGGGNAADTYLPQATKLGVGEAVEFVGRLDKAQLIAAYQNHQLLVHPTLDDAFGMVIAEAMACGRPVVASAVGDIPDLVSDGHTGLLVPPGDSPALAQAVISLLTDTKRAKAMGKAGRASLAAGFSWKTKTAATLKAFEQAAGRPACGHIAAVTPYYPPHLGGMEIVAQQLAEHLVRRNYRVEVLTSTIGAQPHRQPDKTTPGLGVKRLRSIEILQTPVMFGLFWNLMAQPKGTIIHLHVAQALTPEITWLAAKLRGFPLISHIHLDVEASSWVGRIIFKPYKAIFLGFVLRHSRHVIVLSPDQLALMCRKYRLDRSRVSVLPNGVAAEYFQPARTYTRSRKPLALLYAGRLTVQKRADRLIEAMAQLPNAKLDVIGDGDLRPALEATARRLKLKNVEFHGSRPPAELAAAYAAADVLVMPSDREGMPLVALEAMAAGLPIVASNVIGLHELVGGTGILVDDPSPATFAAAIQDLTGHPATLTRLSEASRTAAEAYSWDRLTTSLTQLYTEVSS